jgi:cytidylate kinase
MKIVGIGGTNGSGKDTIGHLLAEKHGYLFVSVTDILREEAKKRKLPIERENLRSISAEWRRESGLGVLIDKSVELFKVPGTAYKGLVIASLRNSGEADRVHDLDGIVVWVDADAQIRYERVTARQRTDEDNKTFEEFLAEEQAEMHKSGDAATLDVAGVKEKADLFIDNNDTNLEHFKDQAEQALKNYLNTNNTQNI